MGIRRQAAFLFVGLAIGLALVSISIVNSNNHFLSKKQVCLAIGSQTCGLNLEVASTSKSRELGLSGRTELPNGHGMLFIFDKVGMQCMWMKDMKFSLDMIWLDSHKNVVKLEKNLNPDTYPKDYCAENSLYVIELNSGVSSNMNLKIGSKVSL